MGLAQSLAIYLWFSNCMAFYVYISVYIWCLKIITFNLFRCIKSLGKLGVDILDWAQLLSPSIPKSSKKSWSNRSDPSVGFYSNAVTKSVYDSQISYKVIDLCKNYAQSNLFTMTTLGIKKLSCSEGGNAVFVCKK